MRIKINNNIFKTKLAVSEKERINGMSGKRFTDEYDSMLFFQDDDTHCFWMNKCLIHLDIIFIKNNKIHKIFHNCKPCKGDDCEHYCSQGELVLEVEGGRCKELNISKGDKLLFLF